MRKSLVIAASVVAVLAGSLVSAPAASALVALPCDPKGVPATDGWNAGQAAPALTGRMRGGLSAYRISCGRVVTETIRSRGLPIRAAEIALTTIIVETTMDNLDGGDGTSVGLFQQIKSSYPNINRNDPVAATNAFLNEMLRVFPDGSWQTRPIAEVCQAVQRSAFPSRYQPQAQDGALLAAGVWDRSPSNMAVYRPGNSTFYLRKLDGTLLNEVQFGRNGDLPAVGHYENSNVDNLAVYRPADAAFSIRWSNGQVGTVPFGETGDLPAIGKFENSPYDNLAVYRPRESSFYIRRADGTALKVPFGQAGDVPAVGHYENSNYDNLAVYRRSEGAYYVRWADGRIGRIPFGNPGDLPAPGHFQFGRYTNLAVYRQSTGLFYVRKADETVVTAPFGDGAQGDVPAVGKFE
jgi:hypothetical protein